MGKRRYISVIVPVKLDWSPCYSLPDGCIVRVGDRVRVRFAARQYVGVVESLDVVPNVREDSVRDILRVEKGLSQVTVGELRLWRKLATYYMCTIGEVYKMAYPAMRLSSEVSLRRTKEKEAESKRLAVQKFQMQIEKLEERKAKKEKSLAVAKKTSVIAKIKEDLESIKGRIARCELSMAQLNDCHMPVCSGSAERENTMGPEWIQIADSIVLSQPQQIAFKQMKDSFNQGKPVLLSGVTGSGKTQLYIKAALEALSNGRNVLYLVPEIALSRQLEQRLSTYFGNRLLVYHSSRTSQQRNFVSVAIRSCETGYSQGYVVLGTRSAIFLPHKNLGLIVIDEEHDNSYKQESPTPRYNGRDAAIMLAKIHSEINSENYDKACNVVLGSATPSMESIYNCALGKFVKVELKERYYGAAETDVEIIDTVAERKKRGMTGSLSRKLIARISHVLQESRQVLVLRSRRSYSPVLQCVDCGYIPKCPHCNVGLSYHRKGFRLVCHYCGCSIPYYENCPECGGLLKGIGAGTQKIEEELSLLFPNARVGRLDSDVSAGDEIKTIKAFQSGEVDILVGTQMITKGFDFPNLSLVAVIQADTLLGTQDFRADEKALQILEQFKGRTGRRGEKGLLVVQTALPDHPVYHFMKSGMTENFSNLLLSERRDFGYPPFTRIINVVLRDANEKRVVCMSELLYDSLASMFTVFGPVTPGVGKLNDTYFRLLRISLSRDSRLQQRKNELNSLIMKFEKEKKYNGHIVLDVDPL